MKVILLEDVKKLGKKGDLVEVAEGYARNYLIPKKLVEEATEGSIKNLRQQKKALEKRKQQELMEAKKLASKLSQNQVTIEVKCGEQGKLFGSITSKDVQTALKEQYKVDIDKRKINLEPIKALGNYEAIIKLAPDVEAKIMVKVVEG